MAAAQKEALDTAVKGLKEALGGTDLAAVRSAIERLKKALGEAGATIYQATTQRPAGKGGEGEFVDAEYRVKEG